MIRIRVIPTLLLNGSKLVKTVRFENPRYVGDPLNAVKIFNEKGVDELVLLDTTASVENRKPNMRLIGSVATESFMPVAYGGGIADLATMKDLFRLGIEKVVVNNMAIQDAALLEKAADLFGSQSIVVSIDAKKVAVGKYEVHSGNGKRGTGMDPVAFAARMQEKGAGELILTSIDREGTMKGYDVELIRQVSASVDIPVIASGGAGKISDLVDAVQKGGASAVAAASMFVFYGKYRAVLVNYPTQEEFAVFSGLAQQ